MPKIIDCSGGNKSFFGKLLAKDQVFFVLGCYSFCIVKRPSQSFLFIHDLDHDGFQVQTG